MANSDYSSSQRTRGGRGKYVKLAIVVLVALAVVIVVLQNTQTVDTQLFFWTFTLSRAVLLLATGIVGFVMGMITCLYMLRRRRSSST